MVSILAIRIRGSAATPWQAQETLTMLNLSKQYNAVVYPRNDSIIGMLRKVQSYITWGELNSEGAKALISRIETSHGKLNDKIIKEKFHSTDELIQRLVQGEVKLSEIEGVKLPIRLHPPKGGFKGKTNAFIGAGGEVGYRGEKINELVKRMV
ncbi:50S ribosomal protein L30 [Metallosphaera cuprina]|uniref:Large ribosomal subunit protein uL30 n=1 Tax=Metallosphaera cuprina (strain Ar-4) TaxID=1006006 RepID=F4G1P1_METCR|nr:50S ribosomal protein L30 [Metallosphaera cuprina]AEB96048.1 50S ribosomal protein L30P [Metallosphaera cuprina Ar-4]